MDDIDIKEHFISKYYDEAGNNVEQSVDLSPNNERVFYNTPLPVDSSLGESSHTANSHLEWVKRTSHTDPSRDHLTFQEPFIDDNDIHISPAVMSQKYPLRLFHDSPSSHERELEEHRALVNYLENEALRDFMEM